MKVSIVGLHPNSVVPEGTDVWAINDYYVHVQTRHLKPTRIYNLHEEDTLIDAIAKMQPEGRWLGDWKQAYRDSGALVVTLGPIEDLETTTLDKDRLTEEFGESHLSCSIAIMICEAVLAGAEVIHLCGVELAVPGEYIYQSRGILAAMESARERGVIVHAANEEPWRVRIDMTDWKMAPDFIQPYWIRERPATEKDLQKTIREFRP
jgi:hypothetical protein